MLKCNFFGERIFLWCLVIFWLNREKDIDYRFSIFPYFLLHWKVIMLKTPFTDSFWTKNSTRSIKITLEKVVHQFLDVCMNLKSKICSSLNNFSKFSFHFQGLHHVLRFHFRLRPYLGECTASRPICEVKLLQAFLVLGWETTWEPGVL
jgi:hypothetical protein